MTSTPGIPMYGVLKPFDAGRKRKDSRTEHPDGRVIKHRASKACHTCRLRKVRCDVLANGTQCTNCRLDGTECVVLPSRRGKSNKVDADTASTFREVPRPFNIERVLSTTQSSPDRVAVAERRRASSEAVTPPTVPPRAAEVPVCVTFDEEPQSDDQQQRSDDRVQELPGKVVSPVHNGTGLPTPTKWPIERQDNMSNPSSGATALTREQNQSPSGDVPLPSFIEPLPMSIPSEDIEFLARKGAFVIPDPQLRVELLGSYVFSMHPLLPILDMSSFAWAILNGQGGGRVSLLLFQAVMFTGLAPLDLGVLRSYGFGSKKQAREAFFERVRLLYEFGVEENEIAVFQSLLLMSWWYGRWNQRRHTWHWTGLAHSVALHLGLHREPTARCGPEKTRRLRRRLWWSLYIRDRLLALGTRRPMRIRDDSFNVSMLTLDDFDLQSLPEMPSQRLEIPGSEENRKLALMCIELAKLSICIGHVLSSQYTTLSTQPDIPHTTMIIPKCEEDGTSSELENCDQEINEWFRHLDSRASVPGNPAGQDQTHSCCEVHWSILNMIHSTLINVLHRTQALQPLTEVAQVQSARKVSRSKVKESARDVTKLAYSMLARDQVRFLGLPGVTALVAACLSHMLDIRSGDEDARDASIFRFYQSMQVLQSLRGIYASADSAVSFVASVIRKTGISVPTQVSTPAPEFMSAVSSAPNPNPMAISSINGWDDATSPNQERRSIESSIPYDRTNDPQQQARGPYEQRRRLLSPAAAHGQHPVSVGSINSAMSFADRTTTTFPTNPIAFDAPEDTRASGFDRNYLPPQNSINSSQLVGTQQSEFPDQFDPITSFFEWNSSLDSAVDFEPIAFNYAFCSDAFGFLHGNS